MAGSTRGWCQGEVELEKAEQVRRPCEGTWDWSSEQWEALLRVQFIH